MRCKHCKWLEELFKNIKDMTNREYWTMTEIFVYLHNGKDYCDSVSPERKKFLLNFMDKVKCDGIIVMGIKN